MFDSRVFSAFHGMIPKGNPDKEKKFIPAFWVFSTLVCLNNR
jgi:hypothetical protein